MFKYANGTIYTNRMQNTLMCVWDVFFALVWNRTCWGSMKSKSQNSAVLEKKQPVSCLLASLAVSAQTRTLHDGMIQKQVLKFGPVGGLNVYLKGSVRAGSNGYSRLAALFSAVWTEGLRASLTEGVLLKLGAHTLNLFISWKGLKNGVFWDFHKCTEKVDYFKPCQNTSDKYYSRLSHLCFVHLVLTRKCSQSVVRIWINAKVRSVTLAKFPPSICVILASVYLHKGEKCKACKCLRWMNAKQAQPQLPKSDPDLPARMRIWILSHNLFKDEEMVLFQMLCALLI